MLRRPIRIVFAAAAWLFVACTLVQVFLAGLGVFRSTADFDIHRNFAFIFGWLTLVMLVLAIVGRLGRRTIFEAFLLLFLFSLQSVFVDARSTMPELAAVHPVNGFLILLVGIVTASEARRAAASPVAA
ncbi:MAG TPA: DUF6220 domain-containing protein [Candidatus Sulfomarinibacteraceae bacterium]|nr:DUF6220 domain-containing protein [Candidatus Sulfomarinibacteraceae bacterium]